MAGLGGGGGIGATPGGLSTSQINVSNNPTAAESEEVLCFDPNEEHRSGNHDMERRIRSTLMLKALNGYTFEMIGYRL